MANYLINFFKHLNTVNKHRFLVCKNCFALGLYFQGLTHDLSKYSPTELLPSVKYYSGTHSPINEERQEKGYSTCWLHHKGINKHHWQYWVDFESGQIEFIDPPKKYVKEMVADRIAACMVYQKDKYHNSSALEFLENSIEKRFIPEKTYLLLKKYLQIVAENDLKTALKIIKND